MKFSKKTNAPVDNDALSSLGDTYTDTPEPEIAPTAPTAVASAPTPGMMLTFDQLKELLAEAKKPVVSPQQLKQIEDEQQTRRDNAAIIDAERAKKLYEQSICSHMRRDGSTRAVYVEHGNYLICQRCQDVIRPEATLPNGEPDLRRREMFTRLFALQASNEVFG
jgi:hypothetical protein